MNILGIVAEFNPFHNGHRHLISEARKRIHPEAVLCVMSGNFVQRGEPAICDKWARTRMALECGADLVIELPFCFAVRSAYYFARGALQLLHHSGVVNRLVFGSECSDLQLLQSLASIIALEPEEYKTLLRNNLSLGLSFPLARSRALQELMGCSHNLQQILLGPNNILALEYLRVIKELCLPFQPFTIPRKGSAYHDTALGTFASATAIRETVIKSGSTTYASTAMPPESLSILEEQINSGRSPVLADALEQAILVKLRFSSKDELKNICEISEGLESRFKQAAQKGGTLEEIRQYIKSKRYSLTRINRTLLYLLFALSKNQMHNFDQAGPQYLHILGFSAKGQKILQNMKIKSSLPLLNCGRQIKNFKKEHSEIAAQMISLDIMASDIYNLLLPNPSARRAGQDFTTSPVRV